MSDAIQTTRRDPCIDLLTQTVERTRPMLVDAGKTKQRIRILWAAASTVEALAYSLRAGVGVLSRKDVRQRLTALDENQLRAMCARLQRRNGRIAPPWPDADIDPLIEAWTACHG
jgi:hypothetical protein